MLPNNWLSSSFKDNVIFWGKIFGELILWVPLTLRECLLRFISLKSRKKHFEKIRTQTVDENVFVCIHEWGGYAFERSKTLKNGKVFSCGLKSQLVYYKIYKGKHCVTSLVTISDYNRCSELTWITKNSDEHFFVDNAGYDFSGYEAAYNYVKDKGNHYIVLSNSSINSKVTDYLDGYIKYMDDNPDVGILGTSMSEKYYQTLIRNNYRPHVQSFFLLTTINVLTEIIEKNNNRFPGKDINHKLLLIREGEVKISQLALDLGYKLAVVQANGKVVKFGRKNKWDNCYSSLRNLRIDNRLFVEYPNRINPIIN